MKEICIYYFLHVFQVENCVKPLIYQRKVVCYKFIKALILNDLYH
jgi:hypothetical protein